MTTPDPIHIMFDLEALMGFQADPRKLADGAITAVGAVPFKIGPERFEQLDEYFCSRVLLTEYPDHGTIDGDTLAWWRKQSREAQVFAFPEHDDECIHTARKLTQVLQELHAWCKQIASESGEGKFYMWSHDYDRILLQGACSRHLPQLDFGGWHRFRDYGTIEKATEMVPFRGATRHRPHDPLDDAQTQATNVVRFFKHHVK